ncbi:MAG TPA: HEAT repeat domain-containing protein [Nodularia sp. (in: cyanobacteria)]|nr:HEAT repeat domain-containing protein [Nodularia sp. (in: cyanobacteria)]
MVAEQGIDFQAYLESICQDLTYRKVQNFYTPTEYRERTEGWDLGLMVQTIQLPEKEGQAPETERIERLNVLEGLRKYADNHVLLKGRPGSGKSTALERLLWEEANKCREGEKLTKIPVLVELRQYSTSILQLIQNFLSRHQLSLDEARIKTLMLDGQFLLLIDGINELPNEDARRNLNTFRRNHPRTSMIFTTRDLGVDLGIEKKLEMQPLSEEQMQQFVCAYLPEVGEEMLRQLGGRLRELGETPLLLLMLCAVFIETKSVPSNLGETFQRFTKLYDNKLKEDVPVSNESRSRWSLLLQHLAFEMMHGKTSTQLRWNIPKSEAENILTEFLATQKFNQPRECAFSWLNDLINHHLIQVVNNEKIEFRHQLLQEYYAAENLLQRRYLNLISDEKLKRDYLNDLNWTESLALMLALVDNEEQALRVVNLALDVDLQLGARLAGEVKLKLQEKTVGFVIGLDVSQKLKIILLGRTHSNFAIPFLSQALNNQDVSIRYFATEALGMIKSEMCITALTHALQDEENYVRLSAFNGLERIGTKGIIPALKQAVKDESDLISGQAIYVLADKAGEAAIPDLVETLSKEDSFIPSFALGLLAKICGKEQIPELLQDLEDRGVDVQSNVFCTIRSWPWIFLAPRNTIRYATLGYTPPYDVDIDRMSHEATITSLRQNLLDKNSSVRRAAVYILGQIGTDEAINALLPALDDQEWRVRFDAVHWLAEIASKTSNKMVFYHLLRYLDDENAHVAGQTSFVLEQKGISELLTHLNELLLKLENRSYANISPSILEVISSIQKRCEFYNLLIFNSPPPEEENQSNPLLDTLNKLNTTMSETPKVQMNFHAPITGSSVAGSVEGDSIGTQNNYRTAESTAEIETVIQKLLEQIEQNKPTPVEAELIVNQAVDNYPVLRDKQVIEQAIENNQNLKIRLRRVVTAVGIETVKIIFAPAGILIEGVKAWTESE